MIYLTPGVTQSVWLSLKESTSVTGATNSYLFTLTHDITGLTTSFYPIDQQPTNSWSKFNLYVGTPESLPDVIDLRAGMYDLVVSIGSTVLETNKVLVDETKTWVVYDRPAKNIKALKR